MTAAFDNLELDHADLVAKLAKPGQEIADNIDANEAHLIHMVLGIRRSR